MVLAISLYERKVLQVRIIIERHEVEQYNSIKSPDVYQSSLHIPVNNFSTFFVTYFVIFIVSATIVFTPAEQCCKIFLLVFTSRINIKTSCNICWLIILKEAKCITCSVVCSHLL